MARSGITYAQVAAVCDGMVARSETPTIDSVRRALGTGSPNTVHAHLKAWRAAQPAKQVVVHELPADLVASFSREIAKAAAGARAEIEGSLVQAQAEADELSAAGEALEEQVSDLTEQLTSLGAERDAAVATATAHAGEIERLVADIARERELAGNAQTETAMARLKLESQAAKIIDQEREIDRLRVALEKSDLARQEAVTASAVLTARLQDAERRVIESAAREQAADARTKAAEDRAEKISLQVSQIALELNAAKVQLQAQQGALDTAAREIEAAKTTVSEARESATKSGEECAELRGQLGATKEALAEAKRMISDASETTKKDTKKVS
jgi:colicin import membrane protein